MTSAIRVQCSTDWAIKTYSFTFFTFYGYITNSQSYQLPDGFIAQSPDHIYTFGCGFEISKLDNLMVEYTVKLSCPAETSDWNTIIVEPPTDHQEFGDMNEVVLLGRRKSDWLVIHVKNSTRMAIEMTEFRCIV